MKVSIIVLIGFEIWWSFTKPLFKNLSKILITIFKKKNKIKILGLLSTDWDKEDGGGFISDKKLYPLVPTEFLIFNPRVEHTSAKVKSDKKRMAIDFTVSKLWKHNQQNQKDVDSNNGFVTS